MAECHARNFHGVQAIAQEKGFWYRTIKVSSGSCQWWQDHRCSQLGRGPGCPLPSQSSFFTREVWHHSVTLWHYYSGHTINSGHHRVQPANTARFRGFQPHPCLRSCLTSGGQLHLSVAHWYWDSGSLLIYYLLRARCFHKVISEEAVSLLFKQIKALKSPALWLITDIVRGQPWPEHRSCHSRSGLQSTLPFLIWLLSCLYHRGCGRI